MEAQVSQNQWQSTTPDRVGVVGSNPTHRVVAQGPELDSTGYGSCTLRAEEAGLASLNTPASYQLLPTSASRPKAGRRGQSTPIEKPPTSVAFLHQAMQVVEWLGVAPHIRNVTGRLWERDTRTLTRDARQIAAEVAPDVGSIPTGSTRLHPTACNHRGNLGKQSVRGNRGQVCHGLNQHPDMGWGLYDPTGLAVHGEGDPRVGCGLSITRRLK